MNSAQIRSRLNVILPLAIIDAVLLIPLLAHRFADADVLVPVFVLGMTHGLLFIALVALCAKGAYDKLWGWWFPIATIVTGGPLGSIVGDLAIRSRLSR